VLGEEHNSILNWTRIIGTKFAINPHNIEVCCINKNKGMQSTRADSSASD